MNLIILSRDVLRDIAGGNNDFYNSFTKKSRSGCFFDDLIFGRGDIIIEYWLSIYFIYYYAYYKLNPSEYVEHFMEWCGSNGRNKVVGDLIYCYKDIQPRSNYFINFERELKIKYESKQTSLSSASGHRIDFYNGFCNTKYSFEETSNDDIRKGLSKGISHNDKKQQPTEKLSDLEREVSSFLVRRACKFLMYDVIINRKASIYYALDSMDFSAVIDKKAIELEHGGLYKVPVCTSEVLELFRMWNFFRGHVLFYMGFRCSCSPWEYNKAEYRDSTKKWCDYAYKLIGDYIKKSSGEIQAYWTKNAGRMENEITKNNYMNAINIYHSCNYRKIPGVDKKHPLIIESGIKG